jgi:hypothetical protein
MTQPVKSFLQFISDLSEDAQYYFQSKCLGSTINELCSSFGLDAEYVGNMVDEYTVNNFRFDGLEQRMHIEKNFDNNKSAAFADEFIGKIFMPLDPYLKDRKIEQILAKRNCRAIEYKKYVQRYIDELESLHLEFLEELEIKIMKQVDIEEEKVAIIDVLKHNLADIIHGGTSGATTEFNGALLFLLHNDPGFKLEALKAIMENNAKITDKKFILKNHDTFPTIKNWLDDFINENGTDDFNNITLMRYLSESENGKVLNFQERKAVGKLLNFYRNIKFYPQSISNLPPEEWQIFPIYEEGVKDKARTTSGPPKTVDEALAHFDREAAVYPEGSLERKAILEEKRRYEKRYAEIKQPPH